MANWKKGRRMFLGQPPRDVANECVGHREAEGAAKRVNAVSKYKKLSTLFEFDETRHGPLTSQVRKESCFLLHSECGETGLPLYPTGNLVATPPRCLVPITERCGQNGNPKVNPAFGSIFLINSAIGLSAITNGKGVVKWKT